MQYEYNQTDFYKYLFLPTKRLYKFNKILVKSVCKNKGNLEGEKRRFNFLLCAQMLFYRNTILHLLTIKRTICIFFFFSVSLFFTTTRYGSLRKFGCIRSSIFVHKLSFHHFKTKRKCRIFLSLS